MKIIKNKYLIILLLFIFGILLITLILQNELLGGFLWANEPFHSFIEASGGLIAIIMAIILLQKKQEVDGGKFCMMALGFLSMGIIDCFHAAALPGKVFVFLHSIAGLFGGFFFAVICLPKFSEYITSKKWIPWFVIIFSVLFGACSFIFPEQLPAMIQNGSFTISAIFINYLAGIFFLVAAVRLFINFYRSDNIETLLLVILSFLFALSGFTFGFSSLWDFGWWLWHLIRLIAYLFVLIIVIREYMQMVSKLKVTINANKKVEDELRKHRDNLEELVEKKTGEVKKELAQRKEIENELRKHRDNLQNLVDVRTAEVKKELAARKQAEESLKKQHEYLEELVKERTEKLEDKNKELDNMLKVFVGRELTIKKLQEKIAAMKG